MKGKLQGENMSDERPNVIAAKAEAKKYLADRPDVLGVGIGDKCVRVYLKDDEGRLGIPEQFKGVPVEFIISGRIEAALHKNGADVTRRTKFDDEQNS